jgi:hypothetical protein
VPFRDYRRGLSRSIPSAQSDGKTFLIVVEGKETERLYLINLRARLELKSADVVVEHAGVTDPMNMIDAAIALRDRRIADAKLSLTLIPYDEVWVVLDREAQNHVRGKQLPNAINRANYENISIALSNPCFEFWLLLHYMYTTKPFVDPNAVIGELKKHCPGYKKNELPLNELFFRTESAAKRADDCIGHHKSCSGDGNPSTCTHILVRSLNTSSAPIFRLL